MCSLYMLSSRSLLSLPVGIVSLSEAPVDAVVEGGAVVADGQAGPVAADGVDAEPAALVLAAVAVVQVVRAVGNLGTTRSALNFLFAAFCMI